MKILQIPVQISLKTLLLLKIYPQSSLHCCLHSTSCNRIARCVGAKAGSNKNNNNNNNNCVSVYIWPCHSTIKQPPYYFLCASNSRKSTAAAAAALPIFYLSHRRLRAGLSAATATTTSTEHVLAEKNLSIAWNIQVSTSYCCHCCQR